MLEALPGVLRRGALGISLAALLAGCGSGPEAEPTPEPATGPPKEAGSVREPADREPAEQAPLEIVLRATGTDGREAEIVFEGAVHDQASLEKALEAIVAREREAAKEEGRTLPTNTDGEVLSEIEVLIRVDKAVTVESMRKVLDAVMAVRIYKVKLAVSRGEVGP
jgi:hypothetical protein